MTQFTVHAAKTHLFSLIEAALLRGGGDRKGLQADGPSFAAAFRPCCRISPTAQRRCLCKTFQGESCYGGALDVDYWHGSVIEKARQCRRLAAAVPNQNDPAVLAVLEMAREFEAQAAAGAEKADD